MHQEGHCCILIQQTPALILTPISHQIVPPLCLWLHHDLLNEDGLKIEKWVPSTTVILHVLSLSQPNQFFTLTWKKKGCVKKKKQLWCRCVKSLASFRRMSCMCRRTKSLHLLNLAHVSVSLVATISWPEQEAEKVLDFETNIIVNKNVQSCSNCTKSKHINASKKNCTETCWSDKFVFNWRQKVACFSQLQEHADKFNNTCHKSGSNWMQLKSQNDVWESLLKHIKCHACFSEQNVFACHH